MLSEMLCDELSLRRGLMGAVFSLMVIGCTLPLAAAEFSPVTEEERALTQVPWQPDAPAVVLFKRAEMRLMNYPEDVSSSLEVHVRVKILKEEGKEHGEIAIAHSEYVRLKEFEGRTILADGSVLPLPEEAIFREERSRARKRYVTKAAFPGLEVGSIIDYTYKVRWDDVAYLEPWYFHDVIPTVVSEINYIKPKNLSLDPRSWATGGGEMKTETKNTARGVLLKVWMENLGAIPDEPYAFPFVDLASRFMIVPKEVAVNGTRRIQLFDSWKSTCSLAESGDNGYKRFRNDGRQAEKKAMEQAGRAATPREKVKAIHAFVRDEIANRPSTRMFLGSGRTADEVLKEKKGTSVEKALLLETMLDAIKVKPALVWASDRRDGRVDMTVANPWWFDKALVRVELEGESLFLDPSDRSLGFGALSPYNEGTPALLHGKKPEVIVLPTAPFDQNERTAEIDLKLDEEGRVSGTGSLRLTGHHAWRRLRWKENAEATLEAWQEDLGDDFEGYEVSEVRVEEFIDERRIQVTWTLNQRQEEVLGDETSLTPSLPLGPLSQLFSLPPDFRLTPVQMAFADRDAVKLTVVWPENWAYDLLPKAVDYVGPAGALVAAVEVDEGARRLAYTRRMDTSAAEFLGRQHYAAIRDLYGEVEQHDAQSVVLVRR